MSAEQDDNPDNHPAPSPAPENSEDLENSDDPNLSNNRFIKIIRIWIEHKIGDQQSNPEHSQAPNFMATDQLQPANNNMEDNPELAKQLQEALNPNLRPEPTPGSTDNKNDLNNPKLQQATQFLNNTFSELHRKLQPELHPELHPNLQPEPTPGSANQTNDINMNYSLDLNPQLSPELQSELKQAENFVNKLSEQLKDSLKPRPTDSSNPTNEQEQDKDQTLDHQPLARSGQNGQVEVNMNHLRNEFSNELSLNPNLQYQLQTKGNQLDSLGEQLNSPSPDTLQHTDNPDTSPDNDQNQDPTITSISSPKKPSPFDIKPPRPGGGDPNNPY